MRIAVDLALILVGIVLAIYSNTVEPTNGWTIVYLVVVALVVSDRADRRSGKGGD